MTARVRPALTGVPFLATLLVAGCADGSAGPPWLGSIDTLPSGAVVVSNPREGLWGPGEAWRLVEEIRIGDVAMEEPEIFAGINGLLADEAGRIYLLDRQSQRVQVFGADGAFLRSIGREGGGPGELRDPVGMTWAGPGRILVADPPNARYTLFDTAGAYLGQRRRGVLGYSLPWRARIDSAGRLSEVAFSVGSTGLIRTDTAFAPADTLHIPEFESEQFVLGSEDARVAANVPYTPQQIEVLGPDGSIWLGDSGIYRIVKLDEAGDTVLVLGKDAESVPVTATERDAAIESLQWFVRQGGRVDPSRIPDQKPFFSGFFVADDGHVWVVRMVAEDADARRLDVFAPDGRYLGAVTAPFAPSNRSVFGEDEVLTSMFDSLGVPYAVLLRIEKDPLPTD